MLNSAACLPFGLGPRMCIGNRFALMETKALILHLLARCELLPCANPRVPMELKMVSGCFLAEDQGQRKFHRKDSREKADWTFELNIKELGACNEYRHAFRNKEPVPRIRSLESLRVTGLSCLWWFRLQCKTAELKPHCCCRWVSKSEKKNGRWM